MRIRIVESGGFAGLRRERVIDTGELPGPRRATLEALVAAAAFFALPERMVSGLPDVIQYRVTVEERDRTHAVTFDDEKATEALRSMVDLVLEVTGEP
jgi:hypothetical protein